MLLRTRVSFFVILTFLVICAGLTYAIIKREDLIRAQYSNERITDQSTLWKKINNELVQRMEDKAWIAAENKDLIRALRTGDFAEILKLGGEITAKLKELGIADRFDAVYADGEIAYSSIPALFPSALISDAQIHDMVISRQRIRGIGNDSQRNIAVVLGIPLRTRGGVIGVAVYATDINVAIKEMERTTDASVVIVNRRGRQFAGTASGLWERLRGSVDINQTNATQTINAGQRVYSTIVLPQAADLGNLVGRLVSINDVTASALRQQQVSQITLVILVVMLAIVLVCLNFYMLRAFAPLSEGVAVLNALSRGDLQVQFEDTERRDEVGRIANAVSIFRANMVSMDRYQRSRERQRARQERFIRRQMSQLADTLDADEREAVLTELSQLEKMAGDKSAEPGKSLLADTGTSLAMLRETDSLAMMALAFEKMSDRVQDQNSRLREALAAKNAFILLQKELDIATRVQLSLLPDTMQPTETFEIAGVMKAAKEVGGDFYDFFRLDETRLGLVVADVSGKGVPASLFMAMTRTLMRAIAPHVNAPGEILASTNNFLESNNEAEMFVTVFYGVLDETTGRFTYASGGHDPPIMHDREGARFLPTTGGALLAMFDGLDYAETHVDLAAGARLILMTDGVTEAFNADEEAFGNDRVLDIVGKLPDANSAQQDVDAIVTAVEEFTGDAPQFDDITCMVLRFRGASAAPAA